MAFLPDDYTPPSAGGHYLKLQPGQTKVRILASPILGYVAWHEDQNGKKPIRARMNDPRPQGRDLKHFWACPVWDYATHEIKIWEVTQQTIQNSIASLAKSEDWGSPLDYDIIIDRKGSGMDTEYSVMPAPKKGLHPDIVDRFLELSTTLNLDALYEGGDPFGEQSGGTLDPENADEIPF